MELNGRLGTAYRFFFRLITAVVPLSRFLLLFYFNYILSCELCTVQYLHTFHFHIRIICYSTIASLLFTVAIVPVFYTPLFCNTNSVLHWTYMSLYAHILTVIFTSYADEGGTGN